MIHGFYTELNYSSLPEDEDFWKAAYKKQWPYMQGLKSFTENMKAQRLGVDRVIYLPFGGKLRFDEKKRRRDWGDVLLEYISNDRTGSPGWIEKPLIIDFIAYAFMEIRKVYFISFPDLQSAWNKNKKEWKLAYGTKPAKNAGYNTLNCPVPKEVLRKAVRRFYEVKV